MRLRTKIAAAVIVALLGFVFLVPVMQVDFISVSYPYSPCPTNSTFGISCGGALHLPGYSSITYLLFGVGGTYDDVNSPGYSLAIGPTPVLPSPRPPLGGVGGDTPTNYGTFVAPSSSVHIQVNLTAMNPSKVLSFSYSVWPNPSGPESSSLCQGSANTASYFTDACTGLTSGDSYEVLVSASNCSYQVSVLP